MINNILHPSIEGEDWFKWRSAYEGGRSFIDRYLKMFSKREDKEDFDARKAMTYCPRFAGAALDDIKISIAERLSDVTRLGGSESYKAAIRGEDGGVDLVGNTMNSFISTSIITELLAMRRVGIYVDMPPLPEKSTLIDVQGKRPYLYYYTTEQIKSWTCGINPHDLTSILLEDRIEKYDPDTNFPCGLETVYRKIFKNSEGVFVQFFQCNDKGEYPKATDVEPIRLGISRIPFVPVELNLSLMNIIADYQIALMNLDSSDINYLIKSNFQFYVEQADSRGQSAYGAQPGDAKDQTKPVEREIKVGATKGRQVPMNANFMPAFIHPSSEPMQISMAKQEQIKKEIRQLLNLSISNVAPPGLASAESKAADMSSLESGLSFIGMRLEIAERQIAEIWSEYEGKRDEIPTISYPTTYSIKTDAERREEAKQIIEIGDSIRSVIARKELAKRCALTLLGSKVSAETLTKIYEEIDKMEIIVFSHDNMAKDIELGLIDLKRASKALLYPNGAVEDAAEDHIDRLIRIASTQTPPGENGASSPAARGLKDLDSDPNSGKKERKAANDTTKDDVVVDKTRGEGK